MAMKVMHIDEGARHDSEFLVDYATKHLGSGAQIVEGTWGLDVEDFGTAIREVETKGPNGFGVPQGFLDHPDAEIIISQFTPYSAKGLDVIKNCHVVGAMRGGLENFDVPAMTERGVLLINSGGYNAYAVSEYTVGMILAEMRSIARSHHATLMGTRCEYRNQFELHDKTVGLVGFGFIGKLVAKELSGFNVKVITYDPYITAEQAAANGATLVSKDELFSTADVVCMHARLTDATYHMVGEHELSLLKPTAYFINTARAGLVDNDVLLRLLQEHKIAGAALDVYDQEPLPADSPFMKLDNVTLTPHRAGATYESTIGSPKLVVDRICDLVDGKKIQGIVNPKVLDNPRFQEWLSTAKERLGR